MTIAGNHQDFAETTQWGARVKVWRLYAAACPILVPHHIKHFGIFDVQAPFRVIRTSPSGSFVFVGVAGRGRVWLDGRWQIIRAGTACMAPPRVLNAFEAMVGQPWLFCSVRYDEPLTQRPFVGAASPVRVSCHAEGFHHLTSGLRREWEGERDPKLLQHWVELLQAHYRRLAQPWHVNDRLWGLWNDVGYHLAEPWDVARLARQFHTSAEQLRRVCHRELGRSPMQQLTVIRIQRAQELLATTNQKMETIAQAVGYTSPFSFSRVFKRLVGCSPSEYRK